MAEIGALATPVSPPPLPLLLSALNGFKCCRRRPPPPRRWVEREARAYSSTHGGLDGRHVDVSTYITLTRSSEGATGIAAPTPTPPPGVHVQCSALDFIWESTV